MEAIAKRNVKFKKFNRLRQILRFSIPSSDRVIWVYNLYRFFLAALILFTFQLNHVLASSAQATNALFLPIAVTYFIFSMVAILATILGLRQGRAWIFIQILLDIILLTLMMQSASIRTSFAVLINAAIASGSLLLGGRIAYVFAAVAALVTLIAQLAYTVTGISATTLLSESGLLTATFFATGLISYELSQRIKASADLADQQRGAIAQLAELNSQVISRLQSVLVVVAPTGKVLLMNEAAQQCFDIRKETVVQLTDCHETLAAWFYAWQDDPTALYEQAVLSVAGTDYDCQFHPLHADVAQSTLILLEDRTRAAQQAQQLKLASLGQFTASIAHEIRNPVGAISHAAQLLSESRVLPDEDKQLVGIIHKQTGRINTIIKNVLQLSRRDQNSAAWIDIVDWLESFIQQAHFEESDQCQIALQLSDEALKQTQLWIDPSHLQQILMNLCSNGLRYSVKATGKATLMIRLHWVEATQQCLLDVIDDGEGVAAEYRTRMFEPFYTTERQGTGLGLYLVKELCELNRAKIHYEQWQSNAFFRLTFLQARNKDD